MFHFSFRLENENNGMCTRTQLLSVTRVSSGVRIFLTPNFVNGKGKGAGADSPDIAPVTEKLISEALGYSTRCQGILRIL